MPVAAPAEGYMKMIAYGRHKASLGWDKLILQSIAAGIWVSEKQRSFSLSLDEIDKNAPPPFRCAAFISILLV